MISKKTIVIGASTNPERYSNKAVNKLALYGHEVIPFGVEEGKIADISIQTKLPIVQDIDTVTLYLNPKRQEAYYDYILSLKPKRIIFNPGTENKTLEHLAKKQGIETIEACTLVMLSVGNY